LKDFLICNIKETDIKYDIVRYKHVKLKNKEIRSIMKFIYIFENLVSSLIKIENFENLKEKDLKSRISEFVKNTDLNSMVWKCFNNT
jgi:hypothetical protein